MALNTGFSSPDELETTRSTSAVAQQRAQPDLLLPARRPARSSSHLYAQFADSGNRKHLVLGNGRNPMSNGRVFFGALGRSDTLMARLQESNIAGLMDSTTR
jgi:hypothetical protein